MISILLALAAAAQGTAEAPPSDEELFKDCTLLVRQDTDLAISAANRWLVKGGGLFARQCLGLAYSQAGRWAEAATAFDQAAREAETSQDPRRADFLVQSGNAWLAAEEAAKARAAFDAALATVHLTPELRGEVHLDRARAAVMQDDLISARADVDKGLELAARDPFAWYLSAGVAMREGNAARAGKDIGKAVELAPDDPQVLLYAATIAGKAGNEAAAKDYYEKVARIAPGSPEAQAARQALGAR